MQELVRTLEYPCCPVCRSQRQKDETNCHNCGFEFVPIDIEHNSDIPTIENAQKKRRPFWQKYPFVVFGIIYVIICLMIWHIKASEYSYLLNNPYFDSTVIGNTINVVLICTAIYAFLIGVYFHETKKSNDAFKTEREEVIAKYNDDLSAIEKLKIEEREAQDYKKTVDLVFSQYGEPDKIYHSPYSRKGIIDLDKDVVVFGKTQYLLVDSKFYSFKEIIGCNLSDQKRIVHGKEFSSTKTNDTDAFFTSVFALVNDTEWTVASGTTARKETVTMKGDDIEVHDYTLFVNVDNITNPTIKIHIGNSDEIANELVGLINVIVRQNQK